MELPRDVGNTLNGPIVNEITLAAVTTAKLFISISSTERSRFLKTCFNHLLPCALPAHKAII
jgi:hypothetical protein